MYDSNCRKLITDEHLSSKLRAATSSVNLDINKLCLQKKDFRFLTNNLMLCKNLLRIVLYI